MVASGLIFGMVKSVERDKKNVTVQKVFGDKAPIDLTLEECKKAIEGKIKAKAKAKKSKKKSTVKKKASK